MESRFYIWGFKGRDRFVGTFAVGKAAGGIKTSYMLRGWTMFKRKV